MSSEADVAFIIFTMDLVVMVFKELFCREISGILAAFVQLYLVCSKSVINVY